jgi:hypothetical protein
VTGLEKAATDWLKARNIIAEALFEYDPRTQLERETVASAIIARLAHASLLIVDADELA